MHCSKTHKRSLSLLLLLAAFTLRMWTLDARAVWLDEAFEFWSAELSFAELPRAVKFTFQPPLYTYLLHLWVMLDMTPIWLRFLSVALSISGIAALLVWAKRELNEFGVIAVGALITTMPVAVYYAQETAEYALLFCTLAWMILCLSSTFQRTDWRIWFAFAAWAVLSIYSHYGALLVVVTLSGATLVENLYHRRYRALYQQIIVSFVSVLILVPLVLTFLWYQFTNMPGRPVLSLAQVLLLKHSFVNLRDTMLTLWINSGPQEALPGWTQWLGQLWLVIFLLACAYFFLIPSAWSAKRILLWFWLLLLVYYMAVRSGAYAYGVWGGRYSSILAPLFVLTGGALVTPLVRRLRITPVIAFLVLYIGLAWAASPYSPFYTTLLGQERPPEAREDMGRVVQIWLQQRSPTEPTYIYEGAIFTFSYYLRLAGLEKHNLLSEQNPACRTTFQAGCADAPVFYSRSLRDHPAAEHLAAIWQAFGRQPERFWLIFGRVYKADDVLILNQLQEQYGIIATHSGLNAVAYLMQRKP